MDEQSEEANHPRAFRFCRAAGGSVIEDDEVCWKLASQNDGLCLTTSQSSAQVFHGLSIEYAADSDPRRAPHFHAASPPVGVLGDFFEHGAWDMNFSGKLMEEVQATDPCESNEGTGVEDEDHRSGMAFKRRDSRSRPRSSLE